MNYKPVALIIQMELRPSYVLYSRIIPVNYFWKKEEASSAWVRPISMDLNGRSKEAIATFEMHADFSHNTADLDRLYDACKAVLMWP